MVEDERPTGNDPDALYVFDVALDRVGGGGLPIYFDRQGNPLTLGEWVRLLEVGHPDYGPDPFDYKVVARTAVGAYLVSTVWLGTDMSFGGPPVLFETMVFADGGHDFDCVRYCTEQEATAGHRDMVTLIRATAQTETGEDPFVEWQRGEPEN